MFIRLYLNAKSKLEAQSVLQRVLFKFKPILENIEFHKIEPYWKIENVYVVEITISVLKHSSDKEFRGILNSIADKWIEIGDPLTELIASDTTEECNFIIDGLKMITIHIE
ncbi:hypothetical protein ACQCVE_11565 [Metabacillus sp. 113a]|uniref:hypothetical protein n=1 Tax=Metabacillus sp. 113a TaxID=3404706 RepID=UPI003CF9BE75